MKPLYSLTITSEIVKFHPRTIMNYEKRSFLKPARTPTNQRLFSNEDLEKLLLLKYLRQEAKLNLAAVKLILENNLASSLFPQFDPAVSLKKIFEEL